MSNISTPVRFWQTNATLASLFNQVQFYKLRLAPSIFVQKWMNRNVCTNRCSLWLASGVSRRSWCALSGCRVCRGSARTCSPPRPVKSPFSTIHRSLIAVPCLDSHSPSHPLPSPSFIHRCTRIYLMFIKIYGKTWNQRNCTNKNICTQFSASGNSVISCPYKAACW